LPFYDDVTVILSLTCCCIFDEVGVTDATVGVAFDMPAEDSVGDVRPAILGSGASFRQPREVPRRSDNAHMGGLFSYTSCVETAVSARVFRVMIRVMSGMISLRMSKRKEERKNSEKINDGRLQNIDKWEKRRTLKKQE